MNKVELHNEEMTFSIDKKTKMVINTNATANRTDIYFYKKKCPKEDKKKDY